MPKLKQSALPLARTLEVLAVGELSIDGLFEAGSNYTFLTTLRCAETVLQAVYKPTRGEQPLWDFPEGTLAQREVAAYELSTLLGWQLVPPTVQRDGPHGPGSAQLYLDIDPQGHWFNFNEEEKAACLHVAVFDFLANNADRKAGHVLRDRGGAIWLIDHGICFHEQPKLRTVIWDFAGQPLPEEILADVGALKQRLAGPADSTALRALLSEAEFKALQTRTRQLLRAGHLPEPHPGRNFPWPPL